MQQRTLLILNRLGLHARAAARLVRLCNQYRSMIWLARSDRPTQSADAKSIFGVLLLAAAQGTSLVVMVEGEDEGDAMEAITQLVEGKFGEE
jgi:phosphocarrier protein HPr